MMRIVGLVPAFFLCLLLGNGVVLVPGQAYAWSCCTGGCYAWMCTCRGTYPCVYAPDDSSTVQSTPESTDGSSRTAVASNSLTYLDTRPDLGEGQLELSSPGKCVRDKLALGLLGNARDGLKLQPVRFEEKNLQEQTLAFQLVVDQE
jgi:hypothetical protein